MRRAVMIGLVATGFLAGASHAADPSAVGRWLVEDKKGVIEIYPCGGTTLCGKLVWLETPIRKDGKPAVDDQNPDLAQRGRPLCGMMLMTGFKPTDPGLWEDGRIYNSENGKTYHAKMTLLADGTLRLRGFIGISLFGESQTWTRADPALKNCDAK